MYERMLDKENKPSVNEFTEHCGAAKELFGKINLFMLDTLNTEFLLRFPYGKSFGWGMKYFIKSKHICDVFAERDAFTVMLRLSDEQYKAEYDNLTDYSKQFIDNKYACGDGGWIHYRVLTEEHLTDIEKLLRLKAKR